MVEIKVQCDCGQRFKFDVEPLHGEMPFRVSCPSCGADGTPKANEILREVLAKAGVVDEYPRAQLARSARGPVRVQVNPAASGTAAPPSGPAPAAKPPPLKAPGAVVSPQAARAEGAAVPAKKPSFGLGFLGAILGAVVGSVIYFLIFNYTGLRLKLLAIGVGYLAGLGAELLGRKEGSKELGMIAAVLALSGIIGAQYFVARNWWNTEISGKAKVSDYETSVGEAKKVVSAIPTGSDQEIRVYLAKDSAEAGEKPDPQLVTEEEIKDFRETSLPHARELAEGKLTKEQFDKQQELENGQRATDKNEEEGTFKAVFLLLLLSKLNLVSLVGAAGLAFKVCSNA